MALTPKRISKIYIFLAVLRFILMLVPQTGYIHPDEFFQSVEVLSGKLMELEVTTPWEFNSSFPVRSMAIPYFTVGMSIKTLKDLNFLFRQLVSIPILSPYSLLVFPRMLMCCLSFIVDYCLYKICVNNNEKFKSRLILLATSYVMLVFGTRTFSNTLELVLLAILLYYVSESLTFSNIVIRKREYLNYRYEKSKTTVEKAKFHKLRLFLQSDSLRNCFEISTITVLGFFNRPTFLAFAVVPLFFWIYRGIGSKSVVSLLFNLRILVLVLCALPTLLLIVLIDSFCYGYITWGEIGMLDVTINSFVFTPWNFFKYNVNPKNLAEHGLHSRLLHALVNIPLLFNILTIFLLAKLVQYVYWIYLRKFHLLPTIRSIRGLMFLTFVTPLALLSLFPHQEPRFLIPLILPIIYLHGPMVLPEVDDVLVKSCLNAIKNIDVKVPKRSFTFFKVWVAVNLFCTVFFGFVHQGGVFQASEYLSDKMKAHPLSEFHIVSSHVYSIPQSFFLQPASNKLHSSGSSKYVLSKRVFLHEEGSKGLEITVKKIKTILHVISQKQMQAGQKKSYKVYFIVPSSIDHLVSNLSFRHNVQFHRAKRFYPHLSTEAFPDVSEYCLDVYNFAKCDQSRTFSITNYVVKIFELFGLSIYDCSLPSTIKM